MQLAVSNDLKKRRNQKYFSTWQSRAWETGKPGMSYINENSFSRWIMEKSDGLSTLGLQKLSESVRDYAYLILTSQTSTRGPIVGHEARNLDAQRTFLNTFENIVNRRVNIPEDIRRFQKTLQYARSKVDYAIGKFVYMLPSDMNLRIGNVRNYNNKILISSPSFNPIQARLFLPFKGPRGVFRDPLMISGTIKASPMKLCTVIVLRKAYQNIKRNFQKYDL